MRSGVFCLLSHSVETEDPWGLLASQLRLISESRVPVRDLASKTRVDS